MSAGARRHIVDTDHTAGGPHDHPVALPNRRHIGARRTYRAGPLVATDRWVVRVVTEKAMEVGAANAAQGDIDAASPG